MDFKVIKKILINFITIAGIIALYFFKYINIIEIHGALPDLFLILIIINGIFNGPMSAMVFGFAAGLALDIMPLYPLIGLYAMIYTIIGYSTNVTKIMNVNNIPAFMILVLVFVLLKCFLFLCLGFLFMDKGYVSNFIKNIFIFEVIYTLIVAVPLYQINKFFYNRTRKSKKYV